MDGSNRRAAAAQIAFRLELGQTLSNATALVLGQIRGFGGEGGLVAVTSEGQIAAPFNAQGMKRAMLAADGEMRALVFEE